MVIEVYADNSFPLVAPRFIVGVGASPCGCPGANIGIHKIEQEKMI